MFVHTGGVPALFTHTFAEWVTNDSAMTDFAAARCDAWTHVVDIGSGQEIGQGADELVVLASTMKVAIALAFQERVDSGDINPSALIDLDPSTNTPGPVGLSLAEDPVRMSLRDLARVMLTISDNVATDEIIRVTGLDYINKRLRDWSCRHTIIDGDLRDLLDGTAADLGLARYEEIKTTPIVGDVRALTPAKTTRSTPRDMTTLLRGIWTDSIATPRACDWVRTAMGQQVSRRMLPATPSMGQLAAKSGGLFGYVRNEIGVITFPGGEAYAFAVFTQAHVRFDNEASINDAMATSVHGAIGRLRSNQH